VQQENHDRYRASVLIADDEPGTRRDLRHLLTDAGHTIVAEAQDGEQALALARSLRPEAVILDAVLPRLSGVEVARTLMGERVAPVILLTGHAAHAGVVAEATEAGALALLAKPLRGEDLVGAVAIARARFHEMVALEAEVRSLNERLEARKLVGRAKAILMERHGLAEREAFRRIQTQSLALGKPVHEIARAIITASEIAV
jgi:two-component system, response regulator PdtaR